MTVHTEILLIAIAVSIACAIPGVFRAASHVHDGRRHYAHRIPRHSARFLCNGRFKLSIAFSRGNPSRRRNGVAYRDDS